MRATNLVVFSIFHRSFVVDIFMSGDSGVYVTHDGSITGSELTLCYVDFAYELNYLLNLFIFLCGLLT